MEQASQLSPVNAPDVEFGAMTYRGRAMSLLADEREFGTWLDGKPKTARLDLRLSAIHGGEMRARCDTDAVILIIYSETL